MGLSSMWLGQFNLGFTYEPKGIFLPASGGTDPQLVLLESRFEIGEADKGGISAFQNTYIHAPQAPILDCNGMDGILRSGSKSPIWGR